MKNLKTKIGITLTALVCFLTFNCNSKKPEMPGEEPRQDYTTTTPDTITIPEPKQEPNPYEKCDFGKITEILEQFDKSSLSYALSDGRIIEFSFCQEEGYAFNYLKMQVSKQSGNGIEKLIIKDYSINGLDDVDVIGYYSGISSSLTKQEFETRNFNLGMLSQDARKKITEEYVSILKDAPERLSREYEKEIKSFEKDILGILKR